MNVSAPDAVVARTKTFAAASDGTKTTCHALPSGLLQLLGLSEFCKRRLDIMKALQIVLRAPGLHGMHMNFSCVISCFCGSTPSTQPSQIISLVKGQLPPLFQELGTDFNIDTPRTLR